MYVVSVILETGCLIKVCILFLSLINRSVSIICALMQKATVLIYLNICTVTEFKQYWVTDQKVKKYSVEVTGKIQGVSNCCPGVILNFQSEHCSKPLGEISTDFRISAWHS